MAIEVIGTLRQILPEVTGNGKNGAWMKQEFVIETSDMYPKKICISAWGDKVEMLKNFSVGEDLKVSVNIESREYNSRWYTDVRAWKIERSGEASSESNSNSQSAASSKSTKSAPPEQNVPSSAYNDDLPF
jgi:hypothetical protein